MATPQAIAIKTMKSTLSIEAGIADLQRRFERIERALGIHDGADVGPTAGDNAPISPGVAEGMAQALEGDPTPPVIDEPPASSQVGAKGRQRGR